MPAWRFLPACIPEHANIALTENAQLKPVDVGRRLDFTKWLIAYDRCYQLLRLALPDCFRSLAKVCHGGHSARANVICPVHETQGLSHRGVSQGPSSLFVKCDAPSAQVASTANVEQRGPMLGVFYDELLRKDWEEMQAKVPAFKPGDAAGEPYLSQCPQQPRNALPPRLQASSTMMSFAVPGSSSMSCSQGPLPRHSKQQPSHQPTVQRPTSFTMARAKEKVQGRQRRLQRCTRSSQRPRRQLCMLWSLHARSIGWLLLGKG